MKRGRRRNVKRRRNLRNARRSEMRAGFVNLKEKRPVPDREPPRS